MTNDMTKRDYYDFYHPKGDSEETALETTGMEKKNEGK